MNILAIDTTSRNASVSLKVGDRILENEKDDIRNHSVEMVSMIEELLDEAKISLEDICIYAVATGPGSFTGIRIGIGLVKGMGFGDTVKAYEMTSLEEIALNAIDEMEESDIVISMIDARNLQIYYGIYEKEDGILKKQVEKACSIDEFKSDFEKIIPNLSNDQKIYIVGDGYKNNISEFEEIQSIDNLVVIEDNNNHSKNMILNIIRLKENGLDVPLKNPSMVLPNYLKKSQAQRQLEKKTDIK